MVVKINTYDNLHGPIYDYLAHFLSLKEQNLDQSIKVMTDFLSKNTPLRKKLDKLDPKQSLFLDSEGFYDDFNAAHEDVVFGVPQGRRKYPNISYQELSPNQELIPSNAQVIGHFKYATSVKKVGRQNQLGQLSKRLLNLYHSNGLDAVETFTAEHRLEQLITAYENYLRTPRQHVDWFTSSMNKPFDLFYKSEAGRKLYSEYATSHPISERKSITRSAQKTIDKNTAEKKSIAEEKEKVAKLNAEKEARLQARIQRENADYMLPDSKKQRIAMSSDSDDEPKSSSITLRNKTIIRRQSSDLSDDQKLKLAQVIGRTQVGSRKGAAIALAATNGKAPSASTLYRLMKKNEKEQKDAVKNKIDAVGQVVAAGFDGFGDENVVILGQGDKEYLGGFGEGKSGKAIAELVDRVLTDFDCRESIRLCFADSTSANSGWISGAVVSLETRVGHTLIHDYCLMHWVEIFQKKMLSNHFPTKGCYKDSEGFRNSGTLLWKNWSSFAAVAKKADKSKLQRTNLRRKLESMKTDDLRDDQALFFSLLKFMMKDSDEIQLHKFSEPSDPRFMANAIILALFYVYRKVMLHEWKEIPDGIKNFLQTYESEIKEGQEYLVLHYGYAWNLVLTHPFLGEGAYVQHKIITDAKKQFQNKNHLLKPILDTCSVNHYFLS